MRSSYIGKGKKEGRSITITDEFRIASGYGSVWVVAVGAELRLNDDRRVPTPRFTSSAFTASP
ncbi:hypothetical protein A6586_06090 [Escherichia coli]|nr:hypothetical protein A6586_06090 [Escherichia coli]HAH2682888.1 hypothetical protein [Escherichia coli]